MGIFIKDLTHNKNLPQAVYAEEMSQNIKIFPL